MADVQLTIDIDKDKYTDFVDKMATITDIYKKMVRDNIAKAFGVDTESLDEKVATPPTPPKVMTPYDVLGVPTSAKADDITVAYRTLLKKHHPDTGDGDTTQLQRVRDAFSLIGNAQKRERYDKAVKLLQKQEQTWVDEASHFRSGVFTPPNMYRTSVGYTSGSAGFTGSIAYPSQASRNGLHVGYQIPQIGGVVGRITSSSGLIISGGTATRHVVEIDATFPQWVVHNWTHWQIQLTDRVWWCDALRLNRSNFSVNVVRIDVNDLTPVYQLGSPSLITQINALGAQIEIEVIEI